MSKRLLAAVCLASASVAFAEPQRALFTHENKFPDVHQWEVGAIGNYSEFNFRDERSIGPYARYTVIDNLSLNAFVPFNEVTPEEGDSNSGIGDVDVGLELRAWQDVFEYPYVIPHLNVSFSTGDEDEGLGAGETVTKVGVSVGTVTYECLHWVADVSYAVNGGNEKPDADNVFIFAGSLIWDLNDQFSVLGEGYFTDEDSQQDDVTAFFQAGFAYNWTESLMTSFYFGGGSGSDDNADGSVTAKAAYTF